MGLITVPALGRWGAEILKCTPKQYWDWLQPLPSHGASSQNFNDVAKVVDGILITVGENEFLKDDGLEFGRVLQSAAWKEGQVGVQVVVQPGGVHNDPYYNFMVKESKLGELTETIIEWIGSQFGSGHKQM